MNQPALRAITVSGFRAIGSAQTIEIRPLTVLAGANNSGKSTIIQPLLLLKQTLLAPFDPGGLRLEGPLLKLDSFFHHDNFMGCQPRVDLRLEFGSESGAQFTIEPNPEGSAKRDGLFVVTEAKFKTRIGVELAYRHGSSNGLKLNRFLPREEPGELATVLRRMIHLGPRRQLDRDNGEGLPESIESPFETYVDRIVLHWRYDDPESFQKLLVALQFMRVGLKAELGLGPSVSFSALPEDAMKDDPNLSFRNLKEMGFGLSQSFPIVVALLYAQPGDLVHIEEPEANLHPKAQIGMAQFLTQAARRGVRVVIETHSSLIIREFQTLVRAGVLPPEIVKLHWFEWNRWRHQTEVSPADLDADGAFGDWPADFDDVNFESERRFLDATV